MTPLLESFVFGAANSVHCACMCGPLALACGSRAGAMAAYQGARLTAYVLVGAVLGGVGSLLGTKELLGAPGPWIALLLGAALLLFALTGERGAVKLPWLGPLLHRGAAWSARRGPTARGAALGLMTPLLPCGLLWAACGAAAVTGSAPVGAQVMGGFALGSLPLLLLVQGPGAAVARHLAAGTTDLVRRGAMALAAGVLIWRGLTGLQGACCH